MKPKNKVYLTLFGNLFLIMVMAWLLAITSLNIVNHIKIYFTTINVIGGVPFPLSPYWLYPLVSREERASPQFK